MSFRLSCRRFLFFVRERSGLRDRMKNKKIRCESRKGIQVKKKIYLPMKLIHRTYLYMKERSGLRDWMKNKKIRYERREDIQAKKKNYLPPKLIYRTHLYSTTPNSITSSCNSIGARGVTGTSRFKATVSCAWNNCFIRLKRLFHTLETTVSYAWNTWDVGFCNGKAL